MKAILGLVLALVPAAAHADQVFNSGNGGTWDCGKDPEVTINTSNATYTLSGACKQVSINGSAITVSIESVDELEINGSKSTISAGAVSQVSVTGASNKVHWNKSLTAAAPTVSVTGRNNSVKGSTSTATTATTATTTSTTTSPAPADTIDCAKKKSVTITKPKRGYSLVGTCDKVAISASETNVKIEATKSLAVSGSTNNVFVGKVDKLAVLGSKNTVGFDHGLTLAKPKVAIAANKGNTVSDLAAAGSAASTTATGGSATATVSGGSATASATGGSATASTSSSTATGSSSSASSGTRTFDCTKQPSPHVTDNDLHVTFTGTCASISIEGNDNHVEIATTKALVVTGNDNHIDVTAVDTLTVPGNDNAIAWKHALASATATAKLSVSGNDNKINQSK